MDSWVYLIFPMLNAVILTYVVWRQVRHPPSPPPHCLITSESHCLLLHDPALLCADCRRGVVARAAQARTPEDSAPRG